MQGPLFEFLLGGMEGITVDDCIVQAGIGLMLVPDFTHMERVEENACVTRSLCLIQNVDDISEVSEAAGQAIDLASLNVR